MRKVFLSRGIRNVNILDHGIFIPLSNLGHNTNPLMNYDLWMSECPGKRRERVFKNIFNSGACLSNKQPGMQKGAVMAALILAPSLH